MGHTRVLFFISLLAGCGGGDNPPVTGAGDLSSTAGDMASAPDMVTAPPDLTPQPDLLIPPPAVPAVIAVPDGGGPVLLAAHATGVQIYNCNDVTPDGGAGDGGAVYSWVFKAPEATLFDGKMKMIGKHYAGPTWELTDGSKVVGAVVQRTTPDASAIPWLLLKAVSNMGQGLLARVLFIQRVNTTAGKAPPSGCDGNAIGATQRVDYTADYYFFGTP